MSEQESAQENTEALENTEQASLIGGTEEPSGDDQEATEQNQQSEETNEQAEEIDYSFELSEDSNLAETDLEEIVNFAKKHGLSRETASELLERQEEVFKQSQQALIDRHQSIIREWREESQKDPEIGGEKLKLHAEQARKAVQKFGGDDFIQMLNETGYGNHPAVIKVFSKIGALISNDEFIAPGKAGVQRSQAETLYPNLN